MVIPLRQWRIRMTMQLTPDFAKMDIIYSQNHSFNSLTQNLRPPMDLFLRRKYFFFIAFCQKNSYFQRDWKIINETIKKVKTNIPSTDRHCSNDNTIPGVNFRCTTCTNKSCTKYVKMYIIIM